MNPVGENLEEITERLLEEVFKLMLHLINKE